MLTINPLIAEVLADPEAALVVSISGGKDGQAMLNWLVHLKKSFPGWPCHMYAIHADLGRIEWPQTPAFVQHLCDTAGIELVVVRREKGDMIARWQERREVLEAQGNTKPFWSSAAARYCTKELKVQPIDKYLRRHKVVVCALGLRAEESANRASKPILSLRTDITTQTLGAEYGYSLIKDGCWSNRRTGVVSWLSPEAAWEVWQAEGRQGRYALTWNPIHSWSLDQVWEWCGTSRSEWQRRRQLPDAEALAGWPAHPCYVLGRGNERMSCSLCVLGSENDLINGIQYNPNTYDLLLEMETESGWTFQPGRSLKSLQPYRTGEFSAPVSSQYQQLELTF